MNKKDLFIIARALARVFVDGKNSPEVQNALNGLLIILRNDLAEEYPNFDPRSFVDLVHSAIGLTLQHGNDDGKLTSVKLGNGTVYP